MKSKKIKEIIDANLQKLIDLELNALPQEIAPEMLSEKESEDEDWYFWLPIKSQVTNQEITEIEERIGYKLPEDYKFFLKYKHFYELPISEAYFCEHPVNTWRNSLSEMVFSTYSRVFMIDKGYIPFASWSDWGYLCFDTNRKSESHNYPVVLWDHEDAENFQEYANDFYDLLIKLQEKENKNPFR